MSSRTLITLQGQFQAERCRGIYLAGLLGSKGVLRLKHAAKHSQNSCWDVTETGGQICLTQTLSTEGLERGIPKNATGLSICLKSRQGQAGLKVYHKWCFGTKTDVEEGTDRTKALMSAAQSTETRMDTIVSRLVNREVNALLAEAIAQQIEEQLRESQHVQVRQREVTRERTIRINAFCGSGYKF